MTNSNNTQKQLKHSVQDLNNYTTENIEFNNDITNQNIMQNQIESGIHFSDNNVIKQKTSQQNINISPN
jgi:hypothetical protein